LSSAFAAPDKIEAIFLTEKSVTQLLNLIQEKQAMRSMVMVAQNDDDKCIPMGDGCFHPQYGIIPKPMPKQESDNLDSDTGKQPETKTFNATETDMIDCKKDFYFDIYCGKAAKQKGNSGPAKLELWIDTSASMKRVDFSKDLVYCERRALASKVYDACSGKVVVSTFDTGKKEVGDLSSLCQSYGTNDGERLVDWMKGSNARHLVIVTDVDEYIGPFREYLESSNAIVHGMGTKTVSSESLAAFADQIVASCK
jgi:hypothetical protein